MTVKLPAIKGVALAIAQVALPAKVICLLRDPFGFGQRFSQWAYSVS